MTSSDNLWEDTDDKGVEEGGGNRSEQQHVSHQGPSGGRPRHRTGHTYAPAASPCVTLLLFLTDLTTFLSNNIYQLVPSQTFLKVQQSTQRIFHAWLQYHRTAFKFERFQTLQKLLKRFINKQMSPIPAVNVARASWEGWT